MRLFFRLAHTVFCNIIYTWPKVRVFRPIAGKNVKGFSTQKLSWGSANGIPFSVGNWIGPDGKFIYVSPSFNTITGYSAEELMNDPTYVEASRFLAQRMLTQGGKTPAGRIDFAFKLATGRAPDSKERAVLLEQAQQALAEFRKNGDEAKELLAVGASRPDAHLDPKELAAWTAVAGIILNLDETITKQ